MKKTTTRKRASTTKARLSHYLYVEVRAWFNYAYVPIEDAPIRQENVFDGPISFDSVVVRAASEDSAYQLGAAAMDTRRTEDPTAFDYHFTGQFLNDWVVKL